MAHINLENNIVISLDSVESRLTILNDTLVNQSTQLNEQILQSQKVIHQLRINNMYKAHENDMVIDENIFENDELD
jgi:hypothetical protein